MYRRGLRTAPWGTPAAGVKGRDWVLWTLTKADLSLMKQMIHRRMIAGVLSRASLEMRPACQTVSKAFSASKLTTRLRKVSGLSAQSWRWADRRYRPSSVDRSGLNPDWLSGIAGPRKVWSLAARIFSRVLQRLEVKLMGR